LNDSKYAYENKKDKKDYTSVLNAIKAKITAQNTNIKNATTKSKAAQKVLNGVADRRITILEERDAKLEVARKTQALADATTLYNDLKTRIEDFTADLKLFGDDASKPSTGYPTYEKPKYGTERACEPSFLYELRDKEEAIDFGLIQDKLKEAGVDKSAVQGALTAADAAGVLNSKTDAVNALKNAATSGALGSNV